MPFLLFMGVNITQLALLQIVFSIAICSFGFLVLVFWFSRVTGIGTASVCGSQPIDSGSLLHATEAFTYLVT
ncbi:MULTISPECIES: hypothetical protein [unclassified Bartonella]|uniref:hypothetical protein n=1 Tax=unclassified Bartonella TaxID=2645622 RepID=UPI0035D0F7DA